MAKVLIIENPEIGDIIAYILQEEGHDTILVHRIVDIHDIIAIMPDILLVHEHINKELTGSAVVRSIKADPVTNNIFTILLSTHPDIKFIARKNGADAYMEKPFDIYQLQKLVRQFADRCEPKGV